MCYSRNECLVAYRITFADPCRLIPFSCNRIIRSRGRGSLKHTVFERFKIEFIISNRSRCGTITYLLYAQRREIANKKCSSRIRFPASSFSIFLHVALRSQIKSKNRTFKVYSYVYNIVWHLSTVIMVTETFGTFLSSGKQVSNDVCDNLNEIKFLWSSWTSPSLAVPKLLRRRLHRKWRLRSHISFRSREYRPYVHALSARTIWTVRSRLVLSVWYVCQRIRIHVIRSINNTIYLFKLITRVLEVRVHVY